MSRRINLTRIRIVANTLEKLNKDVVFVGGATVSLYTDQGAGEARPTDDVDVIVELASYKDYAELEDRLRAVGFVNDSSSKVLCRYKIKGVVVDIMPTLPGVIGFSNIWYPEGFIHSIPFQLDERTTINIFSLPYFIASKIEAFKNRGKNEYRFSTDFEDIVFVMENVPDIHTQLLESPDNVKQYLQKEFALLLNDPSFFEGLSSHLDPHTAQNQAKKIIELIKQVVSGATS